MAEALSRNRSRQDPKGPAPKFSFHFERSSPLALYSGPDAAALVEADEDEEEDEEEENPSAHNLTFKAKVAAHEVTEVQEARHVASTGSAHHGASPTSAPGVERHAPSVPDDEALDTNWPALGGDPTTEDEDGEAAKRSLAFRPGAHAEVDDDVEGVIAGARDEEDVITAKSAQVAGAEAPPPSEVGAAAQQPAPFRTGTRDDVDAAIVGSGDQEDVITASSADVLGAEARNLSLSNVTDRGDGVGANETVPVRRWASQAGDGRARVKGRGGFDDMYRRNHRDVIKEKTANGENFAWWVAFLAIGSFMLVALLLSMLLFAPPFVKYAAWSLLVHGIAIVMAQLLFGSLRAAVLYFSCSLDAECTEKGGQPWHDGPPSILVKVALGFLMLSFIGFQALFLHLRNKTKLFNASCVLGAHFLGFCAADFFALLQEMPPWRSSVASSCIPTAIAAATLLSWIMGAAAFRAVRYAARSDGDEETMRWEIYCAHSENIFVSIAIGLLVTQTIRYRIAGALPYHLDVQAVHREEDIAELLGAGAVVTFLALIACISVSQLAPVLGDVASRPFLVVAGAMSFTGAWSVLFAMNWAVFFYSGRLGSDLVTGYGAMALRCTATRIIPIFILQWFVMQRQQGSTSVLNALILSFTFVIAMSWQEWIDVSIEATAIHNLGGYKEELTFRGCVGFALFTVMLPVWYFLVVTYWLRARDALGEQGDEIDVWFEPQSREARNSLRRLNRRILSMAKEDSIPPDEDERPSNDRFAASSSRAPRRSDDGGGDAAGGSGAYLASSASSGAGNLQPQAGSAVISSPSGTILQHGQAPGAAAGGGRSPAAAVGASESAAGAESLQGTQSSAPRHLTFGDVRSGRANLAAPVPTGDDPAVTGAAYSVGHGPSRPYRPGDSQEF